MNSREVMMLAVEFADFGFGTVVGAVVTGSILIFLDYRRRKDEKKRLFLEEKRLMYRTVSQAFDTMANGMVFLAWMKPYLETREEHEPEASKQIDQASSVTSMMLEKAQEQVMEYGGDFALLGSRASGAAALKVMDVIQRMQKCIISGEYEKVVELRKEYDSASRDFLSTIRQDLGIDP
jgi:hypothetical protein